MTTFTAATLSGVQELQLRDSPGRSSPKESHQESLHDQQCEKHSPGSLSMSASPSFLLEWIPWGSPSPSPPGEDSPALQPSPDRLAPSLLSHTSCSSHCRDAMECTPHLWACVSLLAPAQSWKSPSCCPQGLAGTLDTAFGIPRGGHQAQFLNCKDKRESIRGSFNKGDKRLIDGLINTKPSQGQNSCLSHGSNTEMQGPEVKGKKTTGRSKWEQLLNRVTKREKKSTCQWIWDAEKCWKGTWYWSKKNGTNARQGWKKMQGRWIALGMPRADGTEQQCRAPGGVRSHCHHQHSHPACAGFNKLNNPCYTWRLVP